MRNAFVRNRNLLCALMLAATAAHGADDRHASRAQQQLGGDLFIAGGSVTVSQPVNGDLIAAGGSIDVDAAVAGDAVAIGGKVRIGADVGQSVYAAGGQVTINGKVGRSVRTSGGQVELGPKAAVTGNASIAGGQLRLLGSIQGHVQAAGGRVFIDGPVGGDVVATSGEVELGPNARIAGKLRYRSSAVVRQDPAAQVVGGIEHLFPSTRGDKAARPASDPMARHSTAGAVAVVWTLGLIALAIVLLAVLPVFCRGVARALHERLGMSVLLGFVLLVCTPVAALLLLVTLIGIPLGLLAIALYLALLPVAYVSAGIGLGEWALGRWKPASAGRFGWRAASAAAAIVVLALLGAIPWLGGLVGFAALLAGLGALLLQARRGVPATA
jgi:cytoskeletal protein CcmA (bactofilin family)